VPLAPRYPHQALDPTTKSREVEEVEEVPEPEPELEEVAAAGASGR